jgi:hypothetical protein
LKLVPLLHHSMDSFYHQPDGLILGPSDSVAVSSEPPVVALLPFLPALWALACSLTILICATYRCGRRAKAVSGLGGPVQSWIEYFDVFISEENILEVEGVGDDLTVPRRTSSTLYCHHHHPFFLLFPSQSSARGLLLPSAPFSNHRSRTARIASVKSSIPERGCRLRWRCLG